ncbi:MAG: DUF5104 domain-containing protein [Oscillospiraceae bacterium]|nr:DUF5104 domain-containing protein [Oscillospiraceae bacterium]
MSMKKFICMLGVLILIFNLGGCSFLIRNSLQSQSRPTEADAKKLVESMTQNVLNALDEKNAEKLENSFSKKAFVESNDMDKGAYYTVNLFCGSNAVIDKDGTSYREYTEKGKIKRTANAFYIVRTDQGQFSIYFEYCFFSDFSPDDVGIYSFKLTDYEKAKDIEDFDYQNRSDRAGIYHPGWDEEVIGESE